VLVVVRVPAYGSTRPYSIRSSWIVRRTYRPYYKWAYRPRGPCTGTGVPSRTRTAVQLTPATSAFGEGARPRQHPAVVDIDIFSLTAVVGTLRRPPPGIYSSSESAFRLTSSFILRTVLVGCRRTGVRH
jgi:hypothetical protein